MFHFSCEVRPDHCSLAVACFDHVSNLYLSFDRLILVGTLTFQNPQQLLNLILWLPTYTRSLQNHLHCIDIFYNTSINILSQTFVLFLDNSTSFFFLLFDTHTDLYTPHLFSKIDYIRYYITYLVPSYDITCSLFFCTENLLLKSVLTLFHIITVEETKSKWLA